MNNRTGFDHHVRMGLQSGRLTSLHSQPLFRDIVDGSIAHTGDVMTRMYDARGNIYAVVTTEDVRRSCIELPELASHSAQSREAWA